MGENSPYRVSKHRTTLHSNFCSTFSIFFICFWTQYYYCVPSECDLLLQQHVGAINSKYVPLLAPAPSWLDRTSFPILMLGTLRKRSFRCWDGNNAREEKIRQERKVLQQSANGSTDSVNQDNVVQQIRQEYPLFFSSSSIISSSITSNESSGLPQPRRVLAGDVEPLGN